MSEDTVRSEDGRIQPPKPIFRVSPYHVNHESLKHAGTCVRKLCLIYLGSESDSKRRKRKLEEHQGIQTRLAPTMPFDLPHATALGAEGERSVEQTSVQSMLDIDDQYDVTPQTRYTPTGDLDPDQFKISSAWPTVTEAIEKNRQRMVNSIAQHIDKVHTAYSDDPFANLTIEPRSKRKEFNPDLLNYEFEMMYPQGMVRSSAILFRGYVDFLAVTPETKIIPLEVKTTKARSANDIFQLQCYLNALRFGGYISPKLPYDTHRMLLETKVRRLETIKQTLRREAQVEVEKRIRLMFKRRSIDVSQLPFHWIEHRSRISSMALVRSALETSDVHRRVSEQMDSIHPEYSSLCEIEKLKRDKLITSKALQSIDRGLLIYTLLGETQEVSLEASEFRPVVQSWIDAVLATNRRKALPIPDNAPCSRCGYNQA